MRKSLFAPLPSLLLKLLNRRIASEDSNAQHDRSNVPGSECSSDAFRASHAVALLPFAIVLAAAIARSAEPLPFHIRVTDESTDRGVPLVELKTVHNIRLVTDSAGNIAFSEPGLMDRSVFFFV